MSEFILPKISIIMPVLNRGHTIEKAIASLINQQYPRLEFIIMDGGSTDNTIEIIKKYEPYITYWQSQRDEGPVYAMNAGIEKASGDLIGFLMADDFHEKETLHHVAHGYLNQSAADIITCGGRIVYFDNIKKVYKTRQAFNQKKEMEINFSNVCFAVSAICCRFITKTFYHRTGNFITGDAKGRHMLSNDKEFLMRAALANVKDIFVEYTGYNYFASSDSSTFGNHRDNILRMCHEHMEIAENFLKEKRELLKRKQKFLLVYWYNDQLTRLVLFNILSGNVKKSWGYIKQGWRRYNLIWLVFFFFTVVKIVGKKITRLFKRDNDAILTIFKEEMETNENSNPARTSS